MFIFCLSVVALINWFFYWFFYTCTFLSIHVWHPCFYLNEIKKYLTAQSPTGLKRCSHPKKHVMAKPLKVFTTGTYQCLNYEKIITTAICQWLGHLKYSLLEYINAWTIFKNCYWNLAVAEPFKIITTGICQWLCYYLSMAELFKVVTIEICQWLNYSKKSQLEYVNGWAI